jgi:hypothetical protein
MTALAGLRGARSVIGSISENSHVDRIDPTDVICLALTTNIQTNAPRIRSRLDMNKRILENHAQLIPHGRGNYNAAPSPVRFDESTGTVRVLNEG